MNNAASTLMISGRTRVPQKWALLSVFGIALTFLYAALLWLPSIVPTTFFDSFRFDQSWRVSLTDFAVRHLQAGQDFIFSYGPLGYLSTGSYRPELFLRMIIWDVCVKLILVVLLALHIKRMRWWLRTIILGFGFLLLPLSMDAMYLLMIMLIGLTFIRWRNTPLAVAGVAVIAALSLIKFTFALYGIAVVLVLIIDRLADRQWIRGTILALAFPAAVFVCWCLASQSLAFFPAYFSTSYEIFRSFTGAMSLLPQSRLDVFAFIPIAFVTVEVLSILRQSTNRRRTVPSAALLVITLITLWKTGFVRADEHMLIFFAVMPLVMTFALSMNTVRTARVVFFTVGIAICLAGAMALINTPETSASRILHVLQQNTTQAVGNIQTLLRPTRARQRLQQQSMTARSDEFLPILSNIIGTDTIDVISYQQRTVIANGWHWRPRPVFQNYAACSPALQELNAKFFDGPHAPTYLLYRLETIDQRLPMLDDGESILPILKHYQLVESERDFLLLKRRAVSKNVQSITTQHVTARFDETINLPPASDALIFAKVNIKQSPFGALESAVIRSPELRIILTLEDETTRDFRFVPSMGSSGFLLDPLPESTHDMAALWTEQLVRHVRSFTITSMEHPQWAFAPQINVELTSVGLTN